MVSGIKTSIEEYGVDTVERLRQSLFKRCNQALGALGENGSGVLGHGGIATVQKTGELIPAVGIGEEAHRKKTQTLQ